MKQWDNILKERLERYESPLPDSGLEAFRGRAAASSAEGAPAPAAASGAAVAAGHRRALWLAATAASAAAIAAILLLPVRHSATDSNIQIVSQSSVAQDIASIDLQSDDIDSEDTGSSLTSESILLSANLVSNPSAFEFNSQVPDSIEPLTDFSDSYSPSVSQEPDLTGHEDASAKTYKEINPEISQIAVAKNLTNESSNSPVVVKSNSVTLKTAVITAGPATGAALLACASKRLFSITADNDPSQISDACIKFTEYRPPIRFGLSFRLPLNHDFSLTTGLDYSLYTSFFTYYDSTENKQVSHYLSIPIRLDWSFVQRKILNAYVGAGLKPDFCLAVSSPYDGARKDGPSLSAVAATGLQLNMNQHFGLYFEPELSWQFGSVRQSLSSYRSRNQLMLSASVGLRYTL